MSHDNTPEADEGGRADDAPDALSTDALRDKAEGVDALLVVQAVQQIYQRDTTSARNSIPSGVGGLTPPLAVSGGILAPTPQMSMGPIIDESAIGGFGPSA